ncbi:MAG: stage 0 sporulation family protein [Chloroflexi bacterium]|nr:stage 0 sporulation family protein [Chloroflexota bacterium]
MPIVCGVKFRGVGKVYYFAPGEVEGLTQDDYVIVDTARGRELGRVVLPPQEVDESEVVGELKPVLHRATTLELLEAEHYRQQEAEALEACKEHVARAGLPMKLVDVEYNYDGTRLTVFFTSEQRVDFRELVRQLARHFRTRIELRQIGVRDESRVVGGLGKCGRPLCCATWLSDFAPVSIRMAKAQDLPLSPMEISGVCGRLLCCLRYENDFYQQIRGRFPKVGKSLQTPYGPGKVIKVCVLKETINVLLEDGATLELTADQVSGDTVTDTTVAPVAVGRRSLDAVLGAVKAETPARQARGGDQAPAPSCGTDGQTEQRAKSSKARRPREDEQEEGPSPTDGGAEPGATGQGGSRSSRRARGRRKATTRPNPADGQGAPQKQRDNANQQRPRRRRRSGRSGEDEGGHN